MKLHSNILGQGKPFVILHGFLGMSDNWKTLGKKFSEEGFEVHLVDQRNHGHSFHDDNFDYETLSEDLRHYFEAHDLSEAIVLGHSMGGKVLMHLALQNNNYIDKMIVQARDGIKMGDEKTDLATILVKMSDDDGGEVLTDQQLRRDFKLILDRWRSQLIRESATQSHHGFEVSV